MDLFLSKNKGITILGQYISEVVIPVLPFIIGNCVLSLLLWFMSVLRLPVTALDIYRIMALFNCEIYLVIPFFIASSACKRLGLKILPGLALVAALLYTSLSGMDISFASIIKDPTIISGIQLAILPLLLGIYLYRMLTRWLENINPFPLIGNMIPYFSMGIVIAIALFLIIPLGAFLDNLFRVGILCIFLAFPALGSMILGLLSPILMLLGFLYGDFPVTFGFWQLSEAGLILGPSLFAACVCQGTAALCMAVREKEKGWRGREVVCGIIGFFAFLAPALLAVNLRNGKLLAASLAGGFASGVYYGIFYVIRFNDTINVIIGLVLGIAVTIYSVKSLLPETEDVCVPSWEEQDTLTNLAQKYRIK